MLTYKKTIIIFLLFSAVCSSQETSNILTEKVYTENEVDIKPKLMYGENAMKRFIARNFKSPKTPLPPQKLICSFIVELDGTITNATITNEVQEAYKKEAIRVLNNFDEPWYPAVKENKQVRCVVLYPISVGL